METSIVADEATIEELKSQITNSEKAVKTYSDRINECTASIGNWEAAMGRCSDRLKELNEAFDSSKTQNVQKAYNALRNEANKLGIDISDLPLEATEDSMAELQGRVEALKEEITSMATTALEGAKTAFDGYEATVTNFRNSTDAARESSERFNESQRQLSGVKDNIKRFVGWAGAAKALGAALRNAMADIKELDAAMTEIAVVTNFDISDMWE